MPAKFALIGYIDSAMEQAEYDKMEDGSLYSVPQVRMTIRQVERSTGYRITPEERSRL